MSSLSISDYTHLEELTEKLLEWTDRNMVSLSLPSLRADSFTKELMAKIATVRSSSLTFAPEAGTQRLRDVINKNVTEEDLFHAVNVAYAGGKSQVKLYFMEGLPTETNEDLAGIARPRTPGRGGVLPQPDRPKGRSPQVTHQRFLLCAQALYAVPVGAAGFHGDAGGKAEVSRQLCDRPQGPLYAS